MVKKIFLIIIIIFIIISCKSPFGSGGIKFNNRVGTYQDIDKKVTVQITDKNKDNMIIHADADSQTIDETLSINSYSTSQYLTINSEKYKGYIYIVNLGNGIQSIFLTIRDDKGKNIIFNKKLALQKSN